ncbi:fluoride efflux transporter CrcB [Spirochaetia bacterium 38H-sp]|uniref:Fluoride-specific ion channel FluC n=1 Tax=Rarispira pelagica TaxID=3141764 RepID=A0ABU9UBN7_9SPIR
MTRLISIALVAAGGALGALARWGVSSWVSQRFYGAIPWGTFTVNTIGSFILAFLAMSAEIGLVSPQLRVFAAIGFLGAFTTFSTFSVETLGLIRQGQYLNGFINIGIQIITGLLFAFLGLIAARALWTSLLKH